MVQFHARYEIQEGWSSHSMVDCVVTANDENHATAQLSALYPKVPRGNWKCYPLQTERASVVIIQAEKI